MTAELAVAARRRRERRQRSWWRHEQLSVAAAIAAARHHSAVRVVEEVVTRQEGSEERCTRSTTHHGDRSHLSGRRGQSSCLNLWGRRGLEWAACPCSRVPHLTPVVMVQEAAHDDATISFLLEHILAEKQYEEEVKVLEVQLATREQRLIRLVEELWDTGPEARRQLTQSSAGS